eukprot:COSAG04_NODE_90_length_26856_cov_18.273723_11_plen_112_part_00
MKTTQVVEQLTRDSRNPSSPRPAVCRGGAPSAVAAAWPTAKRGPPANVRSVVTRSGAGEPETLAAKELSSAAAQRSPGEALGESTTVKSASRGRGRLCALVAPVVVPPPSW